MARVEQRRVARVRRDWASADAIRDEITRLGWQVRDTPNGPELARVDE
jgi:cysteinyl-tRNA synthetase